MPMNNHNTGNRERDDEGRESRALLYYVDRIIHEWYLVQDRHQPMISLDHQLMRYPSLMRIDPTIYWHDQ
jgi:hypothetical protein